MSLQKTSCGLTRDHIRQLRARKITQVTVRGLDTDACVLGVMFSLFDAQMRMPREGGYLLEFIRSASPGDEDSPSAVSAAALTSHLSLTEACHRNARAYGTRFYSPAAHGVAPLRLPSLAISMRHYFPIFIFVLCAGFFPGLRASPPPLLAGAIEQWTAGRADLAFMQQTRFLFDNGTVKEERVERYDPSLPDSRRWQLLQVNGRPATADQRKKWESPKNAKPRKKAFKPPGEYLDLEGATLVKETPKEATFEIALKPDVARLIAVEKIAVALTIDKETQSVTRIAADLRQPMRVLLGVARITDLDVDVSLEPADEDRPETSGDVKTGSTARVTLSKMGTPMEYIWSDFKRVTPHSAK